MISGPTPDYYSLGGGFTFPLAGPFGLGPSLAFGITGDQVYLSSGISVGTSGPSAYMSAGWLLKKHASQAYIDSYVNGPSLGIAGYWVLGGGGVWGNEGEFSPNALGVESGVGVRQLSLTESWGISASWLTWFETTQPLVAPLPAGEI